MPEFGDSERNDTWYSAIWGQYWIDSDKTYRCDSIISALQILQNNILEMPQMNKTSKMRYLINEYWKWIKIDNLYDIYKEKVLKVKKWSELSNDKIESITKSFAYWLRGLEEWEVSIESAREHILSKINK